MEGTGLINWRGVSGEVEGTCLVNWRGVSGEVEGTCLINWRGVYVCLMKRACAMLPIVGVATRTLNFKP